MLQAYGREPNVTSSFQESSTATSHAAVTHLTAGLVCAEIRGRKTMKYGYRHQGTKGRCPQNACSGLVQKMENLWMSGVRKKGRHPRTSAVMSKTPPRMTPGYGVDARECVTKRNTIVDVYVTTSARHTFGTECVTDCNTIARESTIAREKRDAPMPRHLSRAQGDPPGNGRTAAQTQAPRCPPQ